MMDTFRRRHEAPAEAEGHRREARDHEPYALQRHARLLHEAELPLEAREVVVEEHHFFGRGKKKGFEECSMSPPFDVCWRPLIEIETPGTSVTESHFCPSPSQEKSALSLFVSRQRA